MTAVFLLNLLIKYGLLTPEEGQFALMTGILPDDFLERLKQYEAEHYN